MLQIKGLSNNECFVTGSNDDVVDVKFKDGSFEGSIAWATLLKVLKRRAKKTDSPAREAEKLATGN